jgi:16S rRNA (cytosine1402-N4)-methyltransferase
MTQEHLPVLLAEAIGFLRPETGGIFVDATLGLGGHSEEILKKLGQGSTLIGIDRDGNNLEIAKQRLASYGNFKAVRGNFRDMEGLLAEQGITAVNGILYDLGVSSTQLDDAGRGFSFTKDSELDMRMDRSARLNAADVVNDYSREDLERVIREYGEERFFRRMADAIIKNRPVRSTAQLASIAERVVRGRQKIHPATRLFQALRIETNGELDALRATLPQTLKLVKSGGRIVAISFHSLEDRIVKQFFARESRDCVCENKRMPCNCGHKRTLEIITRKPVIPEETEIRANPRSRSARLRAAQKI